MKGLKIKTKAAISYLISVLILIVCLLGYMSFVYQLGYPDGRVTDYELIMKYVFLTFGFGLWILTKS